MIKQKLIPILLVLMLSSILVFASCNPTTDGDGGDGGAGDGGNNDGGDGGNNDGGDGGNSDGGNNDGGDGGDGSGDTGGIEAEELSLNEWKKDDFTQEDSEKWFSFNATVGQGYAIYTVDKFLTHPDDPNGGVETEFDNKVGLYKKDASPYTYYLPQDETDQIDLYAGRSKIVCVAEEDKIYVKVTPFGAGGTGAYWIKYDECKKLTITLEKGENVPDGVELSAIGSIEPGVGEYWHEKNSDVTISVTYAEGYYLSEWKNDANGQTDTSITIKMDADKTVGAKIDKLVDQFILTTEVVGGGSIDKDPEPGLSDVYAKDTSVTLTQAPADDTWEFVKWVIDDGENTSNSTDDTLSVTMDKSKTVTAHFKPKLQALALGEWKSGNLIGGAEEQWFYFEAENNKTYELYSHDSFYYHPDNPGERTLDNKVGVYKDNSNTPGDSYTYDNMVGENASGQVDFTTEEDAEENPPLACLEFTAEGTKVWVKATIYEEGEEGVYWVKIIEKSDTNVALNLTVNGKTKDDELGVYVNYVLVEPVDSTASPLVYNVPTGRSALIGVGFGSDRKVEFTGDDSDELIPHPVNGEGLVFMGIKMDADKAITITFSPKE